MDSIEATVLELAVCRDGVVTRAALEGVGSTRAVLRRLVQGGFLSRVSRTCLLVRGFELSWRARLRIALAEAGPEAVVSHAAAAALWNLPRVGAGAVEVTIPVGRSVPQHTIGRVHRTRRPIAAVRSAADGLPVTSPAVTLFDMASRFGPVLLADCLFDFTRRELLTLEQLHAEVGRLRGRGRTGARRMDDLLLGQLALPATDSYLEARFVRLLARHGLPLPETQVLVEIDGRRYRVDFVWHDHRLIVETNGHATHSTRAQLAADAERAARLQAAGWEVVVFTFDQVVAQERYVVAQIGRRLAPEPGSGPLRPRSVQSLGR